MEDFNGFRSEEEYNDVMEIVKHYLDDYTNVRFGRFDKDTCIMVIDFSDDENDFLLSLFGEKDYELMIRLKEKDTSGCVLLNNSWGCVDGIHRLIEGYLDGDFDKVFEDEED